MSKPGLPRSPKEWLLLSVAPLSIALAGGIGNVIELSALQSSIVLNLAAGLTTIPLAHEVLPAVLEAREAGKAQLLAALVGLVLGLALMFGTAAYEGSGSSSSATTANAATRHPASGARGAVTPDPKTSPLRAFQKPDAPFPTTAVVASALDILIDGVLTGVTVGAGEASTALAVALALENGMLSLAISEKLKARSTSDAGKAGTTAVLALAALLGNGLGYAGGRRLQSGSWQLAGILGFATIVVLWLVTQELLPEAELVPGHRLSKAGAFFAGAGASIGLEWLGG